jgi:hypothetical protein
MKTEKSNQGLYIKLSPSERQAFKKLAQLEDITVSDLIKSKVIGLNRPLKKAVKAPARSRVPKRIKPRGLRKVAS